MDPLEFQNYVEIGRRNQIIRTLLRNWCAHAEVVPEGTGGVFQEVTGLPISMCRVTCKHERARGATSMHLEQNALDFHDRNCVGCEHREAVGFPNLSELVGDRDRARQAAAQAAEERDRMAQAALEERAARRHQVFSGPSPAQRDLLALLDRLDRTPGKEAGDVLVSGLRAVAHEINEGFLDAVIAVMEAGGAHRRRAGLLALEAVGYDTARLGAFALEALARGEAEDTAADLAIRHLAPGQCEAIRKAAPRLILLARKPTGSIFERDLVSRPEAMVAAYRLEPDILQAAIRRSLAGGKSWRRAGCDALFELMHAGLAFDVTTTTEALVASFRLPDDPYYDGPAGRRVSRVLAQLLRRFQDPVATVLSAYEEDPEERVRSGVFDAYVRVFDARDRRSARFAQPDSRGDVRYPEAESLAFERIVAVVSPLRDDERLQLAADFMRKAKDWIAHLQVPAPTAAALVGVAALAHERALAIRSDASPLANPPPDRLRQLAAGLTSTRLTALASAILELVSNLVRAIPDAAQRLDATRQLLAPMNDLPESADRFSAALVEQLGHLYGDLSLRSFILPQIYSAMSHPSVRVRHAASSAYVEVCRQVSPEALPSLLHESFLTHFQDPYVAVHQAAVRRLGHLALPQPYRDRAFQSVLWIVRGYRDQAEQDGLFLAEALSQLLTLMPEGWPNAGALRAFAIEVARRLSGVALQRFLQSSAHLLAATPGIGDLILALPFRGDGLDYESEIFLEHLQALPPEEVGRIADRLVEIGASAAARSPLAATPILALLDRNGCFAAAHRLALAAVMAVRSERSTLPERLQMSVYAKALEVETALQEGRLDDLSVLSAEFRRLKAEIEEDDRVNAERRRLDVFP